jgi:hypothetical protein
MNIQKIRPILNAVDDYIPRYLNKARIYTENRYKDYKKDKALNEKVNTDSFIYIHFKPCSLR